MPKIKSDLKQWFDIPDDEYKGKILIRLPKGGEVEAIKERTREMIMGQDGDMIVRQRGTRESIIIAAVSDWSNFIDSEGEQLKCTAANIRVMCREDWFMEFVDGCLGDLEVIAKRNRESEQKN